LKTRSRERQIDDWLVHLQQGPPQKQCHSVQPAAYFPTLSKVFAHLDVTIRQTVGVSNSSPHFHTHLH
jgi:hypothetical protein